MDAAPKLSVVIPAFNEEANLEACVTQTVATLTALAVTHEIVIVNDGSNDQTPGLADHLALEMPTVRALHQENQGIGGAFRTGLGASRGRFVVLWPADMPCPPEAVRPYLAALGSATVIVGCRRQRVGYNPLMQANAWVYPRLVRLLFDLELRDVNWICFYDGALLRSIQLTQNGIPMLTEMLVRLRDRGATFAQVDVDMSARTSGQPTASKTRVMRRTLMGLLGFWRHWRRERRT